MMGGPVTDIVDVITGGGGGGDSTPTPPTVTPKPVVTPRKAVRVGEKGAELFTPATAGTVTPNHQLGDKMGATVVNFNINTVSAKGFNELLNNSRGMITNMINQAVNEKGKANLI